MSAINSLCRTCMTNVADNTEEDAYSCNIFETQGLAEKLMLCSNIEIQPYDEYPPNVCNTCCINILDFCDFQDMCRESLEKFNKMLEKQTKIDSDGPKILRDSDVVVVSNSGNRSNSSDIESISDDDLPDHEIILSHHSTKETQEEIIEINSDCDVDETPEDNDPLTGTRDCVISESIRIARLETKETIIDCEHDYGLSAKDAVVGKKVRGSDKAVEKEGEEESNNADANNGLVCHEMLETILSVDETPLHLSPASTEVNQKMLKNITPGEDAKSNNGASKSEDKCVSNEEARNDELYLFEDFPVYEETFSDINVVASDVSSKITVTPLPLNNTDVTKEIALREDEGKLCEDFSEDHEVNKTHSTNNGFENDEGCSHNTLCEDKEVNEMQMDVDDFENEEECILEDLSEDEENYKNGLEHISEDDEDYVFTSPSEDEEIYSDSDTVLSDREPNSDNLLSCDQCPQTFMLEQELIDHKQIHQDVIGYYKCGHQNCTSSFNRLADFRQHLNDRHGILRQKYKCDLNNCVFECSTNDGLEFHMREHHNKEPKESVRKFVCNSCGSIFKSAHNLRVHQFIHVDVSLWPFKCDIEGCSKSFRAKDHYKVHKNRHYGIKPYACTYCEKRFCAMPNLKAHLNYHTLEKQWVCSFCPKVCFTPALLRHHIRTKHENNPDTRYHCRVCNKSISKLSRKSHEMRHTGERPYVCEICGRSFIHYAGLKKHKETHIPAGEKSEKKFNCSVCNLALATSNSLKNHEMKHTGEKPFECDTCGVKFRYQSSLCKHRRQKLCRTVKAPKDKYSADNNCIEISIINDNIFNKE